MPKIVDHDSRREEIIAAVWRVIARQGIANTTMREIAREAGCSSGVLAHYFASKADLMASAMLAAHEAVVSRGKRSEANLRGLASLRDYMLECLPLDRRRKMLATIEVAFWGQAVGDRNLVKLNGEQYDGFHGRLRLRLTQARDDGELKADVDIEATIKELHVFMDGCSVQAVLYRGAPSAAEQTRMLDDLIARIAR